MNSSPEIKKENSATENILLVLDTSYSLEDITKRGILDSVTCRDLDGYFKHVYSVHPFASIVTTTAWAKKFGKSD